MKGHAATESRVQLFEHQGIENICYKNKRFFWSALAMVQNLEQKVQNISFDPERPNGSRIKLSM